MNPVTTSFSRFQPLLSMSGIPSPCLPLRNKTSWDCTYDRWELGPTNFTTLLTNGHVLSEEVLIVQRRSFGWSCLKEGLRLKQRRVRVSRKWLSRLMDAPETWTAQTRSSRYDYCTRRLERHYMLWTRLSLVAQAAEFNAHDVMDFSN